MKRILLGALTIWGLLVSPALCVGGVLAHGCVDCEAISCAHERDCADDPCNEMLLRTQSNLQEHSIAPPTLLAPVSLEPEAAGVSQWPSCNHSPLPLRHACSPGTLPLLL
jgi:hypothetical protein